MATVKLLQKELRDLAFSGLVMLLLNVLFYGFLLFQANAGNIPHIQGGGKFLIKESCYNRVLTG